MGSLFYATSFLSLVFIFTFWYWEKLRKLNANENDLRGPLEEILICRMIHIPHYWTIITFVSRGIWYIFNKTLEEFQSSRVKIKSRRKKGEEYTLYRLWNNYLLSFIDHRPIYTCNSPCKLTCIASLNFLQSKGRVSCYP